MFSRLRSTNFLTTTNKSSTQLIKAFEKISWHRINSALVHRTQLQTHRTPHCVFIYQKTHLLNHVRCSSITYVNTIAPYIYIYITIEHRVQFPIHPSATHKVCQTTNPSSQKNASECTPIFEHTSHVNNGMYVNISHMWSLPPSNYIRKHTKGKSEGITRGRTSLSGNCFQLCVVSLTITCWGVARGFNPRCNHRMCRLTLKKKQYYYYNHHTI